MNFLLRPLKCTLKPPKNQVYRFTGLHIYTITLLNLPYLSQTSPKFSLIPSSEFSMKPLHIPSIFLILCTSFLVFPPCSVFLSVFCHNMTPSPHDNHQSPTRPQPTFCGFVSGCEAWALSGRAACTKPLLGVCI